MAQEEPKTADPAAPPAPAAKAASSWPPLIAVLVLMPVVAFATTQFLILPKIRTAIGAQGAHGDAEKPAANHSESAAKGSHGKAAHDKGSSDKGSQDVAGKFSFDFDNVVVNLSGSLGTKYLKTSFTLYSSQANLKKIMEENKKQLLDVAINVLSSHTMADLEAAGAKNVVRNALMANFNKALNSEIIEQLFYSEFVVQ